MVSCRSQKMRAVERAKSCCAALARVGRLGLLIGAGAALVAMPLRAHAQANDACATPTALTVEVPFTDTNAAATSTADGVASSCQGNVKNGVWFTFTTGAVGGSYRVSTCGGAAHDTVLTVFNAGITCAGIDTAGNILACNDDNGPGCGGTQASVDVTLAAGSTYLIRLQTYGTGTSGSYTLVVNSTGPASNDACAAAVALTAGAPFIGSNTSATSTNDGATSTCQGSVKNGVWFSFTTGGAAGAYRISTCSGAAHDTVLTVFNAGITCAGITTASNILACADDNGPDCTGTRASVDVSLAAASTYLIRLQTWSIGTAGPFTLLVSELISTGTCCNDTTGACTQLFGAACPAGTTLTGSGTTCDPTPCPPSQACCDGATCTVALVSAGCGAGVGQGEGTTCAINLCQGSCCSAAGACSVAAIGSCSGTQGAPGSTCAPNPCPPPAADNCATPIVIGALGYNSGPIGVGSATNDPNVDPTCDIGGVAIQGIWFSYTPAADEGALMSQTGSEDVSLSVWTGPNCANLTQLLCSDPQTNIPVGLAGGTTYYFLVSKWQTTYGATSTVTFTLSSSGAVISCCNDTTGACTFTTSTCATGTTATGNGVCTPTSCPAIGTCCNNSTGACSQLFSGTCASGLVANASLTCTPGLCPSSGACCTGSACAIGLSTECTGLYLGAGSVCAGGPNAGDSTSAAIPDADESTTPDTPGSLVKTLNVSDVGPLSSLAVTLDLQHGFVADLRIRLMSPMGTIATLANRTGGTTAAPTCPDDFDAGNTSLSYNGVYVISDSGAMGINAAALADGGLLDSGTYQAQNCDNMLISLNTTFANEPTNGTWTLEILDLDAIGAGTLRGWNLIVNGGAAPPCGIAGACCNATTCTLVTSAMACGGTFQGGGSVCTPNPCGAPATGACCAGSTCSVTTLAACTGPNTSYSGNGSACNSAGNNTTPCCKADFNHTGGVTVADIFAFLTAWFAGNPAADINGGGIAVGDIFAFLTAWFSGGCQ